MVFSSPRGKTVTHQYITLPLVAALAPFFGCAWVTPPLEGPVIEDKIENPMFSPASASTLSLTLERRTLHVNFINERLCAEPAAEAGLDLARIFSARLGVENPTS